MPARSRTRSPKVRPAAKNDRASFEVRSYSTLYFQQPGWSKQKKLVEPLVDAIAQTAMWEHLPLLSVDNRKATPRGSVSALKKAFLNAKESCDLIHGGETSYSEGTIASCDVQFGRGGVQISTLASGTVLEALGARALDDFFSILTSLHNAYDGAAHVVRATAWTKWDGNTPEEDLRCRWPLRAIADVAEPGRPQKEDDHFGETARAVAEAKPPRGVTRTLHGGLVMLRWLDGAMDPAAADAAAVRHEAWIKSFLPTEPDE